MFSVAPFPSAYNGNGTNQRTADLIHLHILRFQHKNKAETDNVKTHAAYQASTGYGANQQDLAPEELTVEGEAEKLYKCNIVETHAQSGTNSQDGQQIDTSSAATADTKIDSGQVSVSKASNIIQRENMRQDILEKAHAKANHNNDSDNLKLYPGDFRDVCRKYIPDNSINLIIADPPYSRQHLHLYQPLGIEAFRILKEGGHLVMYAPHYALPKIFDSMENSGLTWWWPIMVKHTGPSATMFSKKVIVTYKPLLWFTKGAKPKIRGFFEDSVESKPPDKSLHPWAQSTVEAEYVISKLTIPNDVVLDCTMGTGTTGIAALKLNRRFVGIELSEETLAMARHNIAQIIPWAKALQGETIN